MSKRKHCYEYTEHRQYKCCECGRTMHKPTPHICNGQYKKHNLKFAKYDKYRYFPQDMLKSTDIQDVRNSLRISVDGVEIGKTYSSNTESFMTEPTKHPIPTNISYSVDMDKDKFDEIALALRLYDKSIKVRRGINGIIHIYSEKMAENLDDPLDHYRQLCHKVNCALTYLAIIKKRKQIFGI